MATVSIRIGYSSGATARGSQAHNDRSIMPDYADPARTKDNVALIKPSQSLGEIEANIEAFSKKHNKRKWQKNSQHFIEGIITFSTDAKLQNKAQLDRSATATLRSIIKEHNLRPGSIISLIRHEDESRPHYHFQMINQQRNGKSARCSFDRSALSNLQDIAGQSFKKMNIHRGKSKLSRIQTGEPFSSTINRSVQELHRDLPSEIEAKEKEAADATEKADKNKRLANIAASDLESLKKTCADFEKRQSKLEKRLSIYEKRTVDAEKKADEAERHLDRIKKLVSTDSITKLRVKIMRLTEFDSNSRAVLIKDGAADIEQSDDKSHYLIRHESGGYVHFEGDRIATFPSIDDALDALAANGTLLPRQVQVRSAAEIELKQDPVSDRSPGGGHSPGR